MDTTISDVSISLTDGLKATTPGDLYYAICLTERIHNLDKCKYTSDLGAIGGTAAGYIIPQQVIWNIEKREVRTGKKVDSTTLRGNAPDCPAFASFGTKGET